MSIETINNNVPSTVPSFDALAARGDWAAVVANPSALAEFAAQSGKVDAATMAGFATGLAQIGDLTYAARCMVIGAFKVRKLTLSGKTMSPAVREFVATLAENEATKDLVEPVKLEQKDPKTGEKIKVVAKDADGNVIYGLRARYMSLGARTGEVILAGRAPMSAARQITDLLNNGKTDLVNALMSKDPKVVERAQAEFADALAEAQGNKRRASRAALKGEVATVEPTAPSGPVSNAEALAEWVEALLTGFATVADVAGADTSELDITPAQITEALGKIANGYDTMIRPHLVRHAHKNGLAENRDNRGGKA